MSETTRPRTLPRYSASERSNHWVVAITFILLALSGLAFYHPAFFFLSHLLGGGYWARVLHPYIGVVFFVCFALLALRLARHNAWEAKDAQWLKHFPDVLANREERLPEVGRYNALQKILFYVLVLSAVGLFLSGIGLWREWFAFSVGTVRLAAVVHALCAFVAITSIIVHIYAAIWVKGSVRAMTRGDVTWGWAWRHHRAWFRQMVKGANK